MNSKYAFNTITVADLCQRFRDGQYDFWEDDVAEFSDADNERLLMSVRFGYLVPPIIVLGEIVDGKMLYHVVRGGAIIQAIAGIVRGELGLGNIVRFAHFEPGDKAKILYSNITVLELNNAEFIGKSECKDFVDRHDYFDRLLKGSETK